MESGFLFGSKDTGRFDNVVGSDRSPRDGGRVSLVENGDLLAFDVKFSVLRLNGSLESTMGRIVPAEIGKKF